MTNIPKQNFKRYNISQTEEKQQRSKKEPIRSFSMNQIGETIHRLTKQTFRNKSFSHSQIIMNWVDIIGPHYGSATFPQHIANGTLTITCPSTIAVELHYISQPLIEKINLYCGKKLITRLKFIYQRNTTSPLTKSINHSSSIKPVKIPSLPPSPLQAALARLGGQIQTRKKGKN